MKNIKTVKIWEEEPRYEKGVTQWFQSQAADFYDREYKNWFHVMTNVSILEVNMGLSRRKCPIFQKNKTKNSNHYMDYY